MKKLMMMAAAMVAAYVVQADFILWTVDSNSASEYTWAYAQIQYYTSSDTTPKYLQATDSTGTVDPEGGYSGIAKGQTGYALLTDGYTDWTFSVVLLDTYGNQLNPSVTSKPLSYSDVANAITTTGVTTDGTNQSASEVATFSVPEPTSGLLLLVGAAMLALKRKRA